MTSDRNKKVNRRGFLGLLSRPHTAPEKRGTSTAFGARVEHAASRAGEFSLRDFYAARGPQKLPPIAIRPGVLHYAADTTNVGLAPDHDAPAVEDDPLYAALFKARGDNE